MLPGDNVMESAPTWPALIVGVTTLITHRFARFALSQEKLRPSDVMPFRAALAAAVLVAALETDAAELPLGDLGRSLLLPPRLSGSPLPPRLGGVALLLPRATLRTLRNDDSLGVLE